MSNSEEPRKPFSQPALDNPDTEQYSGVDFHEIFRRLGHGLGQTLSFALLGLVIAAAINLTISQFLPVSTSARVVFSFPGFAKAEYPDGSKFTSDDLSAPDVIAQALKREGFGAANDFQTQIRAALNIEGIMPPDVAKERDRARSLGQNPPTYVPDEYAVTLTLKRDFPLSRQQRGLLLNAIISAYRDKFERTYIDVPLAFGNAFETLNNADYFEYDQVLPEEIQNITDFLTQQLARAKNYRSPSTNLSFSDLLNETRLFSEIRLNETLGLIRTNGLSRNRSLALVKMNYYLRTLQDQEQEAIEDEKVVQDLLSKAEDRSQSYVLGIKSEATQQRPEAPVLDQGLIDSLLANDAYNLLVRRALDAGLEVKRIQAEKAKLLERKKDMESFTEGSKSNQMVVMDQVKISLNELHGAYDDLIDRIRRTQADFARQQFADAISISDEIKTEGMLKPLAEASFIGFFLGAALGMGLSLLGIYIGSRKITG
jgi:hypothetical protein